MMNNEKEWIGKLCWFWSRSDIEAPKSLGILAKIENNLYYTTYNYVASYCRPVKRDEVEFVE